MSSVQELLRQFPSDEWNKIEAILKDFENAWRHGERPAIAPFLECETSNNELLLIELIHLDLEHRVKAGEPICVESYLKAYPELERIPGAIVDLAATEFALRQRRETQVTPNEYLARFPDFAEPLSARLNKSPHEGRNLTAGSSAPVDQLVEPAILGRRFAGFELLNELGRGGMGVVYKARQINLDRLVALKVILSGAHAGADELARFRAEAMMLAKVRHPNIVTILEVGEVEGKPFFSMELIDGPSLDQTLLGSPQDPRWAANLVKALAQGVAAAHAVGIVHRDLKPANILMPNASPMHSSNANSYTQAAGPKITDFGLARRLEGPTGQTATAAVLGTPSYMAPEQAAGQTRSAGPQADVYSLGAILYECLTGRPPFKAISALETLDQVRNLDPVPPRRLQPNIPFDLETICLKCLQKIPERRYASATALADDLQRFLNGEAITARPEGSIERTVRWIRRRPMAAAFIGVCALASAMLLALSTQLWQTNQQLEDALGIAKAEEIRTGDLLYAADIRLAHQHWLRGDVALVNPLLERHLPRPGHPDRRGFEWHYLNHLASSSDAFTLRPGEGAVLAVAYAPDGTLVSGHETGVVMLWDVANKKIRTRLKAHTGPVRWLSVLDDGKTLATSGDDKTLRLWDIATGSERAKFAKTDEPLSQFIVSPNGRWLAAALVNNTIKIWDVDTQELRARIDLWDRGGVWPIHSLAFSPDSKHLAASNDVYFSIVDVSSGERIYFSEHRHLPVASASLAVAYCKWSRTLLTGHVSSSLRLLELKGAELVQYLGHVDAVSCLASGNVAPVFASGGVDKIVRVWRYDVRVPLGEFRGHNDRINAVAFSPDDETVVSASNDGTIKLWPFAFSQNQKPLATELNSTGYMALSGDGKTLGVVCRDAKVRWIDWNSGKIVGTAVQSFGDVGRRTTVRGGEDSFALGWEHGYMLWKFRDSKEWLGELTASPVHCLAVSPDGKTLAVALLNCDLLLIDIPTKSKRLVNLSETRRIYDLQFSADGKSLFMAVDHAPSLRILDVAAGQDLLPGKHDGKRIFKLGISQDNRLAAMVCGPDTGQGPFDLELWDLTRGKSIGTLLPNKKSFESPTFSPDVSELAVASDTGLAIFDVKSAKEKSNGNPFGGPVLSLAYAPDGRTLATSSRDGTVKFWNSGWQLREPEGQSLDEVYAVSFTSDGKTLVVGSQGYYGLGIKYDWVPFLKSPIVMHRTFRSGGLSFWHAESGQARHPFPSRPDLGANCLAVSPDGKTLLAGSQGGAVWRCDLIGALNRPPLFVTPADEAYWSQIEFGKAIAPVPINPNFSNAPRAIAISPNGNWFATASDPNLVQLWDQATGKVVHRLGDHADVSCLAFTSDGTQLAANDGGHMQFWDVATGRKMNRVQLHKENITALAMSPRGDVFATGTSNRQVQLRNVDGSEKHAALVGHTAGIAALAFTPDGQTLASAGMDGTVRLWHTKTAQPLMTLTRHSAKVAALAFSPDGRTMASGGFAPQRRGEVYLWRTRP